MTGRVRAMEDNVVRVCCSKGIQIVHPPKEPRVTVADVIEYSRWADESAENVVGDCFFLGLVKGEDGQHYSTIPNDVWLDMLSTNEARHLNGQSRFFLEVKHLLQHQGHRVSIDYTGNPNALEVMQCGKWSEEQLVQGPDLSPKSLESARSRIFNVVATEDDKAGYKKALYKEAWGLDRVDAGFVQQYGTEVGNEIQAVLFRVLNPSQPLHHMGDAWYDKSLIFKAVCVGQLLKGLGFCHPLDTDTVITSLEPMKQLSFVQHWDRNSRAFLSKKPVPGKTLDEKGLQEICRAVLKAVGIKLVMDFKRPRTAGGKQVKERRFRLDPESCQEAGELMHLKMVVATEFTGVMDWLEKHPLQRWKHLKDS